MRAEDLGLWLTRGEQPKHVTYESLTIKRHKNAC